MAGLKLDCDIRDLTRSKGLQAFPWVGMAESKRESTYIIFINVRYRWTGLDVPVGPMQAAQSCQVINCFTTLNRCLCLRDNLGIRYLYNYQPYREKHLESDVALTLTSTFSNKSNIPGYQYKHVFG